MMRQTPAGREPGERPPSLAPGELSLNELYFTIQGECKFQGTPTVFVRTSHCPLRCTWCFGADTRVLMGDWTWKRIADVLIGDVVIARSPKTRKLVRSLVTSKSASERETVMVNGSIVTTPDHRFLERSRWRRVDRLVGRSSKFVAPPPPTVEPEDYNRGYLAGVADGDGCSWDLETGGRRPYRRFRLALNDQAVLQRFQQAAFLAGFTLHRAPHGRSRSINGHVYEYAHMDALWITTSEEAKRFQEWLDEDVESPSWQLGYLAGIFDAEGSYSRTKGQGNHLRISQHETVNPDVCQRIEKCLERHGFTFTKEERGYLVHSKHGQHLRFLSWCRPARISLADLALEARPVYSVPIRSVLPSKKREVVYDLTTDAHSFVAEGFIVHNCDSKYTFYEGTRRKTSDVLDEIGRFPTKHVCLTGGEPLAQAESFALIRQLAERGYSVEVETSGSEDIGQLNDLPPSLRSRITINLDVKCPGSAMTLFNRWENLAQLRPHDQLKFIIQDQADYEYAKDVLRRHPVPCVVYVHPVWKKLDVAQIAEWVKQDGLPVRVGVQLHKYIWGDVRGV